MKTVRVTYEEEFSDRQFYRESPLKTDKIAFSIFDFMPWQALHMQRNPDSDTILYFVDGQGFALINDEVYAIGPGDAVYAPGGATYGVLAGENDLSVVSMQSPKPTSTEPVKGLLFLCQECGLEAPLNTGTKSGDINMCPRCEATVKLTQGEDRFDAEKIWGEQWDVAGEGHPGAHSAAPLQEQDREAQQETPARMEFGVLDFQPWQALPMRKNPHSDTLLYFVNGQGIAFVDDEEESIISNEVVYVPAGSTYGILAADNQLSVMLVQGPVPVQTEEVEGLEYDCPICSLPTPVTTNTSDGCVTVCPRCNVKLKLMKAGESFKAEETTEKAPTEAEAQ